MKSWSYKDHLREGGKISAGAFAQAQGIDRGVRGLAV